MKLTKSYLRKIVLEELGDLNSDPTDIRMFDNLRSTVIAELVKVKEMLEEKSDVMGVNTLDMTGVIQDCIQRIQEEPPV